VGDDAATVSGDTVAEPPYTEPQLTKMAAIESWMKGLSLNRKLFELCLPGSHDAGVYRDLKRNYTHEINPGAMTRCQNENIREQAMCGSRVFDIRVFLRKDRSANTDGYTEIPTMGHFALETTHGKGGDYGGTLITALHDAALFLKEQPSEFLIFRIGHTKCTEKVAEVLKHFRWDTKHRDEDDADAAHRQVVIYTGANGNLAHLGYQQLKGKLLLVFDDEKFNDKSFKDSLKKSLFGPKTTDNGYYGYEKYPEYPKMLPIGLSFCGEYLGGGKEKAAVLWRGERGNWTAQSADDLGRHACEEHQKNHADRADHLLWLYWQQTGGNIWDNTTQDPQGMHARLQKFLNVVSRDDRLAMPNVIGHDFVTKETCTKIVKLNPDLKDTDFT
jgi:hypothetical protein